MTAILPKISHLNSRIIRILGCNPSPMTLQGTNTYILGTGHRRILLDTGERNNAEYIDSLTAVMKEQNIGIQSIIITHWHHDHIGGVEDVLNISSDSSVRKFICGQREEDPDYAKLLQPLHDREEVQVEGATVRVHHTPGHTTDHIILELKEEQSVFSGDCILGEGTAVFEDLHTYMNSLQKILDISPSVIYPGHGPVIENPVDRIRYYIDHRNERERQILDALHENSSNPLSAIELVKIIYKDTPEHLHQAAAVNVMHHLEKLLKESKVLCVNGAWRLSARQGKL